MNEKSKKTPVDVLKVASVLLIIALIAGVILGVTNYFTKIDEKEAFLAKMQKAYAAETYTEITEKAEGIDEAYTAGGGSNTMILVASGNGGYKAVFKILIVISDDVILKIEKHTSTETPGLGANVFKEKHLAQYIGKNVYDVDGFENLDAVTAATKSSNAMADAVQKAVKFYKEFTGWAS